MIVFKSAIKLRAWHTCIFKLIQFLKGLNLLSPFTFLIIIEYIFSQKILNCGLLN